jgi:poly-gamma-glutamate capsule biosynthesis protein CapA/YwtB (metallophosphatase superfamily)/transglutaminase-like putative cysteine protease
MSYTVRFLVATVMICCAPNALDADEPQSAAVKVELGSQGMADYPSNTTWGPKSRTIRYEYRLMNPTSKPATGVVVNVPLPLVSPRQEIRYLHLPESRPYRLVTDRHGQNLVRYTLDRLEPGEWVDLGYVAGMTLKNIHWDASELSAPDAGPVLAPEARELYLKAETNYSMDKDVMREAAASLVDDVSTDFEKLVRIHDHVTHSIRYVRDGKWDPAHVVLTRGTGSCSEYNYVLSGLCRLAGLPTRCVGGSSNGHRDLPTTDTVYHRWTEVFLEGYGWFPADCSRDANPIRGDRSHFGRVYVDSLVWCRQAGGKDDSLGWDYRAKAHVEGTDPGIRENHRTRWFDFHPEEDVLAGYAWFLNGTGALPEADLLECALLQWGSAGVENRLKMVRALADAGRNACLWRAAILPEPLQETCIRQLCLSSDLADTILKESRDLYDYRNWFRSYESRLVPGGEGRFELSQKNSSPRTLTTTASSSRIWADLVPEVVSRAEESVGITDGKTVVVMPVTDQTLAGLGKRRDTILAALKDGFSGLSGVTVIDEVRFNDWMEEQGPGIGQYWILANGGCDEMPSGLAADIVLAPVCITSKAKGSVLYHLELKALELGNCKYTKAVARVHRKAEERASTEQGVLVAGGDTVLARWEHDLVARHGYDWPLAGVKDVLESADGALCNLECCVSMRGEPADKGEHCPFYYRARPEMLRCLTEAGIDMVTAANNHGGDYGPVSVADTAMWCAKAGLVCVGNGNNLAEAEAPRLVRIGPVVVGLAGMDATKACFAAEANRPGTNYASTEGDLRPFAEKVERLRGWADGRCDLLVLTIHWGKNWVRETQSFQRKMARIAFEHGVDVILGHSAHRLQGIEVVDGKPVVYDMGNLLFDCKLKPEGRRSALFRLHLSARGVHKIEVLPVEALEGRTVLGNYDEAQETLSEMGDLCKSLGTGLSVEEDLEGRPVGVIRIKEPKATPRGRPDSGLACAGFPAEGAEIAATLDGAVLNAEIPETAQKLASPVELAPNVELIAYELPDTAEEGGLLHLATWWRVTGPVDRHVMPAFHISPGGKTPRRGTPWYTRHDAADWTVPLCRLEGGMVVKDRYPARLAGLPTGTCKVSAVVLGTARSEGSRTLGEPHLVGEVEIVARGQ